MPYRSPAFSHTSPEFKVFLSHFTNLCSKIKNEDPYASFFTGDFNGHSQFWWPDGDTTSEGRQIENLMSSLNLSQLIVEQTNFESNKNPSCIDLALTDQPNLELNCGTRASLASFCHHEITYCKVNFNIPLKGKFGIMTGLTYLSLKGACSNSPGFNSFRILIGKLKHSLIFFLNIMTNFIPNEIKRIIPRDPPSIIERIDSLKTTKDMVIN